jgi:membrane fusion protein (multidrug efflux system)
MSARIVGAALALLVGCAAEQHPKSAEAAPLPPQSVRVEVARKVVRPIGDEVVGTVRARSVTAISSSVMGTIRVLKVKLGSRVRPGDVLMQLAVGEIEAKAAQASALFAQAGVELKRAEQLKASQSIPSAQYDAAAAQYRIAEAALAEAEAMRSYTVIRAPFAGVITDKLCTVGDLALPGKPLLVLESPGTLRLEAAVPEGIAHFLHEGDVMQVRLDAAKEPLEAKLSELSPSADPGSRTVLVKLDLPNVPDLRAGMFGRLTVRTGAESSVRVPAQAIVRRGQLETLFVAERGKAALRLIRAGRSVDGETEVLAGLEGGEAVVVEPVTLLADGQPIEVRP